MMKGVEPATVIGYVTPVLTLSEPLRLSEEINTERKK